MCLLVYLCENEMVVYREKGYVPAFCVGEEQFNGRDRSRCILKDKCHSGTMLVLYNPDNLGRFKGPRDIYSVDSNVSFNINDEN
jgi:hypothetical protein